MDFRLLAKLLGILSLLIGLFMLLSLLWASPYFGQHTDRSIVDNRFETRGFLGLLFSSLISCALGGFLLKLGKSSSAKLYRKEAMAVVGLSWVLATVLGALPFVLSGTCRGPSIRTLEESKQVLVVSPQWKIWSSWTPMESISDAQFDVLTAVVSRDARGLSERELIRLSGHDNAVELFGELQKLEAANPWLIEPGSESNAPVDRASQYRLRWVPMGFVEAMFESQSGFSTTGATVICDLEDPHIVPRCILFWRASTHFLGGLGIIVLFVVLLGQGSAGKALMRAEMPGPTHDNSTARIQHNAWRFAALYVGLNILLAIVLYFLGMSVFDALCHSFATMATGGFSTYNGSLGHFVNGLSEETYSVAIEYVVIAFMLIAGTNFTLLYLTLAGKFLGIVKDIEFRTYICIVIGVSATAAVLGISYGDPGFENVEKGIRASLFQTASIITTTGYGTSDFDAWNNFSRALLLCCMFIGGCAGSTGGGMKVIRHVLFFKILGLEVERAYSPKVVQLLKLNGTAVEDQTLRHSILVYFGFVIFLFINGWLFVMFFEPDLTWGANAQNKLLDSASAVISTLNNIGPGLGICGPTANYADFCTLSKSMFILMMMLGRLEIFPVVVLFAPGFWRDQ